MRPGPSEARCGHTALPRGLGGGGARGGQGRPAGGSGSRPARGAGGFGLLVCKVGPAGGGASGRRAHRVSPGAGPTAATPHMCRGFAILGRGSVRQALDLPSGQESTGAGRRPPFRWLPPRWPCDGFTKPVLPLAVSTKDPEAETRTKTRRQTRSSRRRPRPPVLGWRHRPPPPTPQAPAAVRNRPGLGPAGREPFSSTSWPRGPGISPGTAGLLGDSPAPSGLD